VKIVVWEFGLPLVLMVVSFVLFVLGGYGYFNQPQSEPPWPEVIPGFAFSPYEPGASPFNQRFPSHDSIRSDLQLLSDKTHAIRTYTVDNVFGDIPALAKGYGLNVALGAWLSEDELGNNREMRRLVEVAKENPKNVVRLIVGNETLLRKDLTIEQLASHLEFARNRVNAPVSTAEPWHVWIDNPELVNHVDYLAVHMLPFWEGIPLDQAVEFIANKYELLRFTFPDKPIVIAVDPLNKLLRPRPIKPHFCADFCSMLRSRVTYIT
jgi:exo-beta-1,3-glucanase (GH17 family)